VLRPCIVAGPKAPALADAMPWNKLPGVLRSVTRAVPVLKPLVPDPGRTLQLVHHDDVANAIALAATTTTAPPGAYNIAGDGEVSFGEVISALGGRPVPVPEISAAAASAVLARLPFVPGAAEWLHIGRTSMVMDIGKAYEVLGWRPRHTARQTLDQLAGSR
jgi:UDP-glucose 4-epimerase